MAKHYEITKKDLDKTFDQLTAKIRVECEFTTDYVGGQPADDKGLEAFCKHHLGLEGERLERAIRRIKKEEIGEKDKTEPLDELKEKEVYSVNIIRSDDNGPWIGCWQIKACLKCACSRLGVFQKKRGTKGDMSELGKVTAFGASEISHAPVDRIYLYNENGEPVKTKFKKFMGSVSTPKGKTSICHDSETAPPGTKFAFCLQVPPEKFSLETIKKIMAFIGQIGLGSVKALERGKFKIEYVDVEFP